MKVLLVFRGNLGPVLGDGDLTIPEILLTRGTSHPSEVNALLVAHWLQQDHGHEVHWYTRGTPGAGKPWTLRATGPDVDPADYDLVLLWKIRGVKTAIEAGLFDRLVPGVRLATWFDAGGLAKLLTDDQRSKFTHIVWGTQALADSDGRGQWGGVEQGVVEHATGILSTPTPELRQRRALYIGRLPAPYMRAVAECSATIPVDAFALSIPGAGGEKLSLRPGQYSPADLQTARDIMSREAPGVRLMPAVNLTTEAANMSGYLFGLVPPTRISPPQRNGASKAWDCWGLGLPVVLGENTPEADHVRTAPIWLGELYDPGDTDSLRRAVDAVVARAAMGAGQFLGEREAIQRWTHDHHTYRHRAMELNDVLTR